MANLSKRAFDALSANLFANATQLNGFFIGHTGHDFIDWFNLELAGKGTFAKRRISPDSGQSMEDVKKEFADFWNAIPFIFKQPVISVFDFAALACIVINETGGRFRSISERCRQGRLDDQGRLHAGLPYAFDKFKFAENAGGKRSYNTLESNLTAHDCFASPLFCEAHKDLALAARVAGAADPTRIDAAWKGKTYPADKFLTINDTAQAGFIMQADFYKFRGRGPIQITGRAPYRQLVQIVQQYNGPNPVFQKFRGKWQGLSPDDACTVSRNADWEELFEEKLMVGLSVRAFAEIAMPSKNLLVMQRDLARLNTETRQAGSFFAMGRIISGSDGYARNTFKPRVVELLEGMADVG